MTLADGGIASQKGLGAVVNFAPVLSRAFLAKYMPARDFGKTIIKCSGQLAMPDVS